MSLSMISQQSLTARTSFGSTRSLQAKPSRPQRALPMRVGASSVTDPEEERKNKIKKAKEGQWAQPGENPNPLEKTTFTRAPTGGSGEASEGGVGENLKTGLTDAGQKVGDAVKKVTGQD